MNLRCGLRSSRAAGSGATLPRPAFDAFHRQHQAERHLDVGRLLFSTRGTGYQRPDVPPRMFCAMLRWQMLLNELAHVGIGAADLCIEPAMSVG
jgi:hypothetical protein